MLPSNSHQCPLHLSCEWRLADAGMCVHVSVCLELRNIRRTCSTLRHLSSSLFFTSLYSRISLTGEMLCEAGKAIGDALKTNTTITTLKYGFACTVSYLFLLR